MRSIKNSGVSKKDLVEKAKELPKKVTKSLSEMIRRDYDAINQSISKLDHTRQDYPELKHKLQALRANVPKNYALPKDLKRSIIEEINKILGVNRSDVNY